MATTIQFYQLLTTPLERALPKLLEKAFAGGFKVLVLADSEDQVEQLNQLLWTYDPGSFLPHGSMKDDQPENQPILISHHIQATNNPGILLVTNGATPENPETFERILDIFDGSNKVALEKARTRWTNYKNSGHTMSYMKQTDSGGWEKKTVA